MECMSNISKQTQAVAEYTATKDILDRVVAAICHVVLGKEHEVRLALTCLLANGHLLIEDVPGVGKTTLAHSLACVLGLGYQRIQFTSDLLPADIIGVSVYQRDTASFSFHRGPIFNHLILADEINRATPRAQSALLEAMGEKQITAEGETYDLPRPFFVIATQNPSDQVGTFPLPESQLDRFTMCIRLGYPDATAERQLLHGGDRLEVSQAIVPLMDGEQLSLMQAQGSALYVSDNLLDYLQRLLEYSRLSDDYVTGLSPRCGLAVLQCARAWALSRGASEVLPEDVQQVLPAVIEHRLQSQHESSGTARKDVQALIRSVPVPL